MCGLYGIINDKEAPFDFGTFCTLGIANDARGGDSCGIFIDGQVEYGIDKKAKFEEFFWDSKLLLNTETCKIALGHDRKASVGGISLDKAHPIVIKNNDKIEFVLIHNGTIHNYKELAKEFIPNKKIDDLSDSQVLALMLYHSGFDCLEKYNGGAAFVAVDYRKEEPEILIFRGESKLYSSSTEESMERPLYIARKDDNSLVFSSIPSYLFACCQELYTVPKNQVCYIKGGKLHKKKSIDRSKCIQTKVTYTSVTTVNNYSSYNSEIDRITVDYDTNRYKIGDRYLHGYFRISEFGRIAKDGEKDTTYMTFNDIYAFNGIIMLNKKCLCFVYKVFKTSPTKDIEEFTKKNEYWIRYFSFDQLYFVDKICLKAIDPHKSVAYSGSFQMYSSYNSKCYLNGIELSRSNYGSGGYDKPVKILKSPREIKFKEVWKDIQQLMR